VAHFAALAPTDASLGGKARGLAVLAAEGYATPAGFVLTDELFRALRAGGPPLPRDLDAAALAALDRAADALESAPFPETFEAELAARLISLGAASLSVRSSFATEDQASDIAAGIYESRTDVALADVGAAVRAVLRSAVSPAAAAYARARGLALAGPPVAVLVHAYVAGDAHGHAAHDPRSTPLIVPRTGALTPRAREQLDTALRALADGHGPVEIEWTASGDAVTFLQLRPFQAPAPAPRWSGFAGLPPEESARWRWDAAHNPLPLSPAQAGLVALADERCRIGIRQRVLGGYLFHAPGGPAPPQAIAPHQVRAAFDSLRADAEARLAALGAEPDLEAALALFLSVYEPLFGVIQPGAREGRNALERFLRAHLPGISLAQLLTGVHSMASERRRLASDPAQYLALFGDEAAIWDLAEPTYRERGLTAVPAATVPPPIPAAPFASLSPALRAEGEQLLATARACAAVGEDDDWLYARLQTAVRRAILALGRRLEPALDGPEDLFYWPLPAVRAAAAGQLPPDPRALTRAGRVSVEAARRDPPPASNPGAVLRGSGTGGRALGRVHHHDRAHPVTDLPDAVLVAHTLLPTELPLLRAAALVTDTGGPLDHVAAQARERSLPAVVGAAGASRLAEGALVLVDADQGLVIRL